MNLFKKTTATVALVALVSGIFSTGVSASSTSEIEAANALAANGYINNHADDTAAYNLNQNVLRQEIAAVARGIAGLEKKSSCDNSFADVTATTPNTWACYTVEALLDADLIAANETFRPEAEISKAEAVGMMVKAAFGSEYAYDASSSASWQEQVVDFAVSKGVVASFTNYDTPATRGFVFEAGNNADVVSSEVADECDEVSQLLGLCGEDDMTEEDTTEEDTTVVVSGDNVLTAELSPETPNTGYVAAATPRTPILAFDVTAGSEDVSLDEVRIDYTGLSDYNDIDNVKLYIGNTEVSKSGRNFTDKYVEISFENDTVIMAGETKTVVVTAEVQDATTNSSHQLTVTKLTASSDVEMTNMSSMHFDVVAATNVSELDLNIDEVTGSNITIGKEIKLADFELREVNDNEDVIVKSLTFALGGSMYHKDDLADISLEVEGEVVASNLMVNSDEEVVVVDLDYTIPADERATFVLRAVVTGSVSETLSASLTEVYAIGAETGINSAITGDAYGSVAAARAIEGSEINVSFDKSDIDEAKPDAEEVLVGTLNLASDGEYNLDRIQVKVDATGTGVMKALQKLELDGRGYDVASSAALLDATTLATTPADTDTTVYFYFEDISLYNEALALDLTFDVINDVNLDTVNLTFTPKIVAVKDDDNNEKYDLSTSNGDVSDILSTNALDDNSIDIATANAIFTSTAINDRLLVLGNGVEVVAYKGKISVGDADGITITDMNFVENAATTTTVDLDDVIDSAELNIGGKTFSADIDADSVDFNTSLDMEAGVDNVEVLMTLTLKDNDSVVNNQVLALELDTTALAADIEDTDGNDVTNLTLTDANSNVAINQLLDRGTFAIKVLNDVNTDDNIENTILAGTNSVPFAEVELEAEYEDVKVKELAFDFGYGDYTTTIDNVRLMDGPSVIAEGAVVTLDSSNHTIATFKDDFIVLDSYNLIKAELVADVNNVTGEAGVSTAVAGNITVQAIAALDVEAKGYSSNDDLTADVTGSVNGEVISVVPTKLVFSVVETLNNGNARIKVTADSGNNTVGTNDQIPTVVLTTLNTTNYNASDYLVYRDDTNSSATGSTVAGLPEADRTFEGDSSATFVFVPQTTLQGTTYNMELKGDVATYDVRDSDNNDVSTALHTILDSSINVGTKTY